MIYELLPTVASPETLRSDPLLAQQALDQYQATQSGILTAIPSSIAYLPLSHFMSPSALASLSSRASHLTSPSPYNSPNSNPSRNRFLARQFTHPTPLGQIEYNFDVSNYSSYFRSEPGKKYGTMLQMLQYPFSRGSIHIPPSRDGKATTVDDKPMIDPKYYEGEGGKLDFEIMVQAQKFGHKICCTSPLSSIIVRRVFPPEPPAAASPSAAASLSGHDEEEDFSDWVRNYTITDWHPVGTCSMGGRAGIKEGVVDDRLRVYGTKNLRVVDASVMPLQVSAHIQATVYAIGEKGASLVLEDWERVYRKRT